MFSLFPCTGTYHAVCMTASFGRFSLEDLLSIIRPCGAKAMKKARQMVNNLTVALEKQASWCIIGIGNKPAFDEVKK